MLNWVEVTRPRYLGPPVDAPDQTRGHQFQARKQGEQFGAGTERAGAHGLCRNMFSIARATPLRSFSGSRKWLITTYEPDASALMYSATICWGASRAPL